MGTSCLGTYDVRSNSRVRVTRPGFKLRRPLICHDCGQLRNLMADTVVDAFDCTVGFRCVKCSQKVYVKQRPKGLGWRSAFKKMISKVFKKPDAK